MDLLLDGVHCPDCISSTTRYHVLICWYNKHACNTVWQKIFRKHFDNFYGNIFKLQKNQSRPSYWWGRFVLYVPNVSLEKRPFLYQGPYTLLTIESGSSYYDLTVINHCQFWLYINLLVTTTVSCCEPVVIYSDDH